MRLRASLPFVCLVGLSCEPSFDRRPSEVRFRRLLAVRTEPAEAAPGSVVDVEVLVIDPSGAVRSPAPELAFCTRRRPAGSYNSVADPCLDATGPFVEPAGSGFSARITLPRAGCDLFGSEPRPPGPSEAPLRAADPDATGGYYQPLRVRLAPEPGDFGRIRISCALAGATAQVAREYRARYAANQNPELTAFESGSATASVARGRTVTLVAKRSPASRESYVVYAPTMQVLETRVESLRVSWLATAGMVAVDVSDATDSNEVTTEFTAPEETGLVHLWAVLRDDRGGVSFRGLDLEVR